MDTPVLEAFCVLSRNQCRHGLDVVLLLSLRFRTKFYSGVVVTAHGKCLMSGLKPRHALMRGV